MKWAVFVILIAGIMPLSHWLRRNPNKCPKIWMLMGFLPFVMVNLHLYMALDSWAYWPGYVKGIEVSVLDGLALAFYLALPKQRNPLPFRISISLYFAAVLLSVFQADSPTAALFYCWQLARIFLLYAVVSRASAVDRRVVPALMTGMGLAIMMEAGFAIWERFGEGLLQASGTADHQNTLGLWSHFVIFPFFALMLAGQRGWLTTGVLLAGVIIQVLTASRATLGLAGVGYIAVFALSVLRSWTLRKAIVLSIGVAAIAVIVPVVLSSLQERGDAQMQSSDAERIAFETASAAMLSDHPLGIGANHFVVAANTGGYYERAGVSWTSYVAIVHNLYWLVACETGYFGWATFMFFLFQPLIVAFLCGWKARGDARGELLTGFGVALLLVYIHSAFEWIFIIFESQYIFALDLGLLAGLAQQLGYWRPNNSQKTSLGVGAASILAARNRS